MYKFDFLGWSVGTGKGRNCGHSYTSIQITENSKLLYMEYSRGYRNFNFHLISYMQYFESGKIGNESNNKKVTDVS